MPIKTLIIRVLSSFERCSCAHSWPLLAKEHFDSSLVYVKKTEGIILIKKKIFFTYFTLCSVILKNVNEQANQSKEHNKQKDNVRMWLRGIIGIVVWSGHCCSVRSSVCFRAISFTISFVLIVIGRKQWWGLSLHISCSCSSTWYSVVWVLKKPITYSLVIQITNEILYVNEVCFFVFLALHAFYELHIYHRNCVLQLGCIFFLQF